MGRLCLVHWYTYVNGNLPMFMISVAVKALKGFIEHKSSLITRGGHLYRLLVVFTNTIALAIFLLVASFTSL